MEQDLREFHDEPVPEPEPRPGSDLLPPLLVRLLVGFLGFLFGFPALWIAIGSLAEPSARDLLFPLLLLPSMITVGLAAAWAALSAITPVRTAAWAVAGCGAGFLLDGILGCLDPGEVLGPSFLVLGLVFTVIGYRENRL
jgi:ABC-type Na+ efflux pump permease subunit